MQARVLRRDVARARLRLAHELPAAGQRHGHPRAGREAGQLDLEPPSALALVLEQEQRAADDGDRDVEVAVRVVVGHRAAAGVQLADVRDARALARVGEERDVPLCGAVLERLRHLGVLREIRERHVAVGDDDVDVRVEIEVGPRDAPARSREQVRAEDEPLVGEGRRRKLGVPRPEHAVALPPEVRHEEIRADVPVVVAAGDAHARTGVGHARLGRDFLEAEAEPRRIGLLAAGPGDVLVEAVRLGVVREVDVQVVVEVDVGEHDAEAVGELHDLEPGFGADLTEASVALVQEQQVADTEHRRRKPTRSVGDGVQGVRVARHDEVGQAVAVHVAHGRAGAPAERRHARVARALREVAVAVVPQEQLLGGGRDVEIGVAVRVEIGGDAACPADGEVRARVLADVLEAAVVVPVERRLRQAALAPPARSLDHGVRVDDEEIERAVAVVVEPAEARALHGGDIGCGVPPERPLAEVEPDLVGDVDETRAARRARLGQDAGLVACSLDPQAASVTAARAR